MLFCRDRPDMAAYRLLVLTRTVCLPRSVVCASRFTDRRQAQLVAGTLYSLALIKPSLALPFLIIPLVRAALASTGLGRGNSGGASSMR